MEQQIVIDLRELSRIGVECSRCHAQFIVDAENDDASLTEKCMCCRREDFSAQGVQDAIRDYVKMYRDLKRIIEKTQHKITLRAKPVPTTLHS